MSEIKQKRLQILSKLFGEQIKQKIETENLDISVKELFNKFVDYEITESGKYLEWMTKTYINNGFLYEDLYKVKETLEIFHENKMKLSKEKRDIQQYKTLADLWIEVKKFVEQKDDFLSTNEQKRKEKELAYAETEFLYEDDNLRVVAPLTETASKWWGKGTRWCTAAENNNMFYDYFKHSPLLIFDFKDGEKWQLWLENGNIQFMDEDDNNIKIEKIKEKWNLIENIFKKLININIFLFKYIPEEFKNKRRWISLIKKSGKLLKLCPKKYISKELCEIAIKQNGLALEFVPKELITYELCKLAIENKGLALKYVPYRYKTKKICEMAIENNSHSLTYVPNRFKTKQLCETAVNNKSSSLFFVPYGLKTLELCEKAILQQGTSLQYTPEKFVTKEICEMAVKQNGKALKWVPKKLKTYELYKLAVEQDGMAFFDIEVDNKIITEELCKIAVKQNGKALFCIPYQFKTKEICEIAVNNNGFALNYVPHYLKTQELCEIAIKNNGSVLNSIPKEFIKNEYKEISTQYCINRNNLKKYKEIFQSIPHKNKFGNTAIKC